MGHQPTVFIGMITPGEISAATARSLFELARETDWLFDGPIVGTLIQHQLAQMTHVFLAHEHEVLLRIDSDTFWDDEWLAHFRLALEHVHAMRRGEPWALGAVIPKRRRKDYWQPAISVTAPEVDGNQAYADWAMTCYQAGALVRVDRVGGGFTAYSRVALERIGPKGWEISWGSDEEPWRGIGEDYILCDKIRAMGGSVFARWPARDRAEIGHWNGTEVIHVEDFLGICRANGIWATVLPAIVGEERIP